jgi:Icc-related predicted phosphoesterase
MKIQLESDVHLEFGQHVVKNVGADVLILSGDICVANALMSHSEFTPSHMSQRFHNFFVACSSEFKNVVYVMGNHEHYHGDYATTYNHLRDNLSYLPNVHVLEKQTVVIDDVMFIGGTLWTDMNRGDALTMHAIRDMMNDFRCVMNSNREVTFKGTDDQFHKRTARFLPADALDDHDKMMQYIRAVLECATHSKYVVVGHHAPSTMSVHARYKDDYLMNGGYSSDLSEFILDHPQIKLWTHGHTHHAFDYMIGSTRVVCNPRGYVGYENNTGYNPSLVIEV